MKIGLLLAILALTGLVVLSMAIIIYLPEDKQADNVAAKAANNSSNLSIYHYTKAYKPYTDADYYIDPVSGIVLTAQNAEWRNGYGIDIRGFEPDYDWKSEFFCQPDTVIFCYGNDIYAQAYLNYLVWVDDIYQSDSQVIISLLHMSDFGNVLDLLPEGVGSNMDNPPVDIIETHMHSVGGNDVRTDVTVRNRGQENMTIVYVYQDSAYLWYPRNSGDGTIPVFFQKTDNTSSLNTDYGYSDVIAGNRTTFVGYADMEHGVLAGLYSCVNDSKVGLINYYIGLVKYGIRGNDGQQFEVMNANHTGFTDIPGKGVNYQQHLDGYGPKNQYVAFELKDIPPGEARSFTFYRIMYYVPGGFAPDDLQLMIINGTKNIDSSLITPDRLPEYHPEGVQITGT
ncbi:MAG: hypothetical protein WBZ29_08680 [Methanocella sp.]